MIERLADRKKTEAVDINLMLMAMNLANMI